MTKLPEFKVATCEDRIAGRMRTWVPKLGQEFSVMPVGDVFGVRRAVMPIFEVDESGRFEGLGTAFSADPWNTLLTAHHVIDRVPRKAAAAILSFGRNFGTVKIPNDAIAGFSSTKGWRFPVEDPMAELRKETRHVAVDLAVVKLSPGYNASFIANLPLRAKPAPIAEGDWVFAMGFPGVEVVSDYPTSSMSRLQNIELKGAFGRVTGFYETGRDRTSRTPVFEVEGHWPLGMSGGPIVNQSGEVVGVVSRGIDPGDGHRGTSWGVWLERVGVNLLVPTIDDWQPQCRRCWATTANDRPTQVFPDNASAQARSAQTGETVYKIRLLLGTKRMMVGWDE